MRAFLEVEMTVRVGGGEGGVESTAQCELVAEEVVAELAERSGAEGLGEDVSEVAGGGDVVERDHAVVGHVVEVVMAQVDVLGPAVGALVLAEFERGLVVAEDLDGQADSDEWVELAEKIVQEEELLEKVNLAHVLGPSTRGTGQGGTWRTTRRSCG